MADGRKQHALYDKYEVSPPALFQDGFLGTLAIDAFENRYVAIADVVEAFLKA